LVLPDPIGIKGDTPSPILRIAASAAALLASTSLSLDVPGDEKICGGLEKNGVVEPDARFGDIAGLLSLTIAGTGRA
jgi:hypothetical protein